LNNTLKYDELPEKGLSAGLILKVDAPTASGQHYSYDTTGDKFRLVDWITEVKIITDGKRPLKDLGGAEFQGAEYWNSKKPAVDFLADRTLYGDHCLIPIAFGRELGDLEYYFNWGDYDSIELDIKNILDSTLHVSATIDIINLKIVDGESLAPSKGIFQERIWRTYQTVQDRKEYFKLPIGSPLRRILIRAVPDQESSSPYRRSDNFYDLIEQIKLTFGDGGEVALDTYSVEQMELMHMLHGGEVHTGGTLLGNSSGGGEMIRTGIGRMRSMQATKAEVGTSVTEMNFGIYTYLDDLQSIYFDTGTNQYVHWDCFGLGYNNIIPIRFDLGGIDKMLDTVAKAPIQLELDCEDSSTAEDGTVQLILSELVSR